MLKTFKNNTILNGENTSENVENVISENNNVTSNITNITNIADDTNIINESVSDESVSAPLERSNQSRYKLNKDTYAKYASEAKDAHWDELSLDNTHFVFAKNLFLEKLSQHIESNNIKMPRRLYSRKDGIQFIKLKHAKNGNIPEGPIIGQVVVNSRHLRGVNQIGFLNINEKKRRHIYTGVSSSLTSQMYVKRLGLVPVIDKKERLKYISVEQIVSTYDVCFKIIFSLLMIPFLFISYIAFSFIFALLSQL